MWRIVVVFCASFWCVHSQRDEKLNGEKWVCYSSQCIQLTKEISKSYFELKYKYPSLEVCRLTCGPAGPLWPFPTGITLIREDVAPINPNIRVARLGIQLKTDQKEFVEEIINIFKKNVARKCHHKPAISGHNTLNIKLKMAIVDYQLNMTTDEKYHLYINESGTTVMATITGETVFGVRHGLETLSQLIAPSRNKTHCLLYVANSVDLNDSPTYPHRGLMLDTSSHYIPIDAIKRTIDGMAASKLNVFHWHISDSHSFPFKSQSVPEMSEYGAFSDEEVYTIENIVQLVRYARYRGVRIMPEIDGPANTGNGWQWGKKKGLGKLILCHNYSPWYKYCKEPPCGQLNPLNDNVYRILGKLFRELQAIFDPSIVHLGGREVTFNCWQSSNETSYLARDGETGIGTNYYQLWEFFHYKSLLEWDRVKGDSASKIVLWSSSLIDTEIMRKINNRRFVIEVSSDDSPELTENLLNNGYGVILGFDIQWPLTREYKKTFQFNSWTSIYDTLLPDSDSTGILGGEAVVWAHAVDEHSIDVKVWPRAAALAEKLWSDPDMTAPSALPRFVNHRDELVTRGIKAEAVVPHWCKLNGDLC